MHHFFRQPLIFVMLCLWTTFSCPRTASATKNKPQVIALLIGVGNYKDPTIEPLKYTGNDVRGLAHVLLRYGKISQKNIRVLLSPHSKEKADTIPKDYQTIPVAGRAKRTKIEESLNWLYERAEQIHQEKVPYEDITVIVYFSGHGKTQGEAYWLPEDTNNKKISQTGIKISLVQKHLTLLRGLRIKRMVVITDACQSGMDIEGAKSSGKRKEQQKQGKREGFYVGFGSGVVTMASSKKDQSSYESEKLKHSIFTHVLIRGLMGKADANKDNTVDVVELASYLRNHVASLVKNLKGPEAKQEPALSLLTDGFVPMSFPNTAQEEKTFNVKLNFKPAGVSVSIDEQMHTKAAEESLSLRLKPGGYLFTFEKEGYEKRTKKIHVIESDTELDIELKIRERKGKVGLQINHENTHLYVDGRYRKVDGKKTEIDLPIGEYTFRLQKEGYRPWERRIRVAEGGTVWEKANLERQTTTDSPLVERERERFTLLFGGGGGTGGGGYASLTWNFSSMLGLYLQAGGNGGILDSNLALRSFSGGSFGLGLQLTLGGDLRWFLRAAPGAWVGGIGAAFALLASTGVTYRFRNGFLLGGNVDAQSAFGTSQGNLFYFSGNIHIGYAF